MPAFEQKFTIHPIGQGLFYSGVITHNNHVRFRMIFDCGCLPAPSGASEPKCYRHEVFEKEKELDLLVISHFDADHINHIKTLLMDDVKVKRIVMPFTTFEERIFLIARYILRADKSVDINTVDFIVDPSRALAANLGDGGEFYLIDSVPDMPIPPKNEEQNFNLEVPESRFLFSFAPQVKRMGQLTPGDAKIFGATFSNTNTYKIKDTEKGILFTKGTKKLMEFLFYKKDIGLAEEKFFKKVNGLFLTMCGVDITDNIETIRVKIIEKVKKMKGAKAVKNIFSTAMKYIRNEDITITKTHLADPNTTAICMLHRNLKSIFSLIGLNIDDDVWLDTFLHWNNDFIEITTINKVGTLRRVNIENFFSYWKPLHLYRNCWALNWSKYPNTLLTSDSFIKDQTDVNAIFDKYQHYLDDFWLFQVPHHGSENNADKVLLSQMPIDKWNFINYGVSNSFGHPHIQLLNDIVATGHSEKLIPINEFQGILFGININI